jgi:methylphosphotriester-DNA--protein-cysteine methyltransferase
MTFNDFGMSVREYQRLLRFVSVLADVRREKFDALALRAGYRSRKDFYLAFARLTGLTPFEYRHFSDEQALQIHEKASLRVVRHTHRGGNSTD